MAEFAFDGALQLRGFFFGSQSTGTVFDVIAVASDIVAFSAIVART